MRHRIRQLLSRLLLAGGMLAVVGAALWFWLCPTQVSVAEVYMREISPAIQGVGAVEAKVVVQLAAKIPGRIVAINVHQGDTARRGQALIQLENSESDAEVERAVANLERSTDLTAKEMRGITDGEIYWVTTNGVRKSGMPAFKSKATDQGRWQMTVYIKHLMGEHSHAGTGGKSQAQQSGQPAGDQAAHQSHDAHHAGVNERGDKVMGFSHEKTAHHFRLKADGGLPPNRRFRGG
jgi:hypothetical protein